MHDFLAVIVGFEKGVTNFNLSTGELPMDALALTGSRGFALAPDDGWQPQMPTLKDGGVWAESSTSTGRTLIAGSDGNVTESMRLVVGTGEAATLARYIVKLNRFIELAREHWTTFYQTFPVYLKWKATCGAGFQYALIYNIDATIEFPGTNNSGVVDATLSIEREPYWRALPPGANPKRYALDKAGTPMTNLNDQLIASNAGHFKTQIISNKQEWSPTALGLQTTLLSQNFVDIAAADVPGDAPALAEFGISTTGLSLRKLYVSKSTKPTSGISASTGSATTRYNNYVLAAGDAGVNLGAKVDVSASPTVGLISNGSSTLFYNYQYTVPLATTTFTPFLTWGRQYTGDLLNLDRTLMSGKFALFVRAAVTTVGAADGDVVLKVVVEEYEDSATQVLAAITTADDIAVQTSGLYLELHYAGVITIPFEGKRNTGISGFGRQIRNTLGDFRIRIEGKNTSGANRLIMISDLIMMPIDDDAIRLTLPYETTGAAGTAVYDATGYFDLGNPNGVVKSYISQPNLAVGGEIDGGIITLAPGKDQRLYFLMDMLTSTDGSSQSPANQAATVALNIVPRWRGIRDQ